MCNSSSRASFSFRLFFSFSFFFFQIHQIVLRHQRFFSAFCLGLKRIGFQACMECLPRAIYDLIYLAVIFLPCMYGFNNNQSFLIVQ